MKKHSYFFWYYESFLLTIFYCLNKISFAIFLIYYKTSIALFQIESTSITSKPAFPISFQLWRLCLHARLFIFHCCMALYFQKAIFFDMLYEIKNTIFRLFFYHTIAQKHLFHFTAAYHLSFFYVIKNIQILPFLPQCFLPIL